MTQATMQPNFAALAEIAISWQARNGDGLAGFCCKLTSEEEVLLFLAAFLCHKSYDVNGKLEKSMLRAGSIGPKVAVIGGGFSGAAIAARLLRSRQVDVDVIEERPRLGLGLAYGDAQDGQILNVPAGRMSFWAEQPTHFLDWTKLRGPQLGRPEAGAATVESYLPRRLYGCYVADVMDAVAKKADIRIEGELVHYRNRAIALDQIAGGYRVTLADGQSIDAAAVVIATGNNLPAPAWPIQGQGSAYIDNPWSEDATAHLDPLAPVLVIGTGLTMVDMVLRLNQEGHRGRITAISRHGLLPRTRGETFPSTPAIGVGDTLKGALHLFTAMRAAIARQDGDWRSVIDGLRPTTNTLWQALTLVEKRRLLRHVRPWWEVHRHRMPEESAETIYGLIAEDRLSVRAARVDNIEVVGVSALVRLQPRATRRQETHRLARVINCTPGQSDIARTSNPLLADMRRKGFLRPDPLGLGADCDEKGALRNRRGEALEGLFAIGPILQGNLFEATAVPDIRLQADALARSVGAFLRNASACRTRNEECRSLEVSL
jgi:uncharacterized NAD(P)/FAD-binding protein YdhS